MSYCRACWSLLTIAIGLLLFHMSENIIDWADDKSMVRLFEGKTKDGKENTGS